jgi:hypothetical protein
MKKSLLMLLGAVRAIFQVVMQKLILQKIYLIGLQREILLICA